MSSSHDHDRESDAPEGAQSLVRLSSLSASRFGALVGESEAMRSVFGRLERAAETDAPILLEGPAGTGKEDAAAAVHKQSARSSGPFIVVDCAASTEHVLERELFGDEVAGRPGAVERADGGTLFLDEVGALSLELQARVLRIIEQKTVMRVSGVTALPVDARVIASSRSDLRKRVSAGGFRSDLYFRLSVMRIVIASLSERRDDFLPIARYLLDQAGADATQTERFTSDAFIEHLRRSAWPDNVRGLRAYLERCLVMEREDPVGSEPPPPPEEEPELSSTLEVDATMKYADARKLAIAEFEKRYLRTLLDHTQGNVSQAAREAGIDRVYMHRLMRRHRIRR